MKTGPGPHPLEIQAEAMASAMFGKSARDLSRDEFEALVTFWRAHQNWRPGDPVTDNATPTARRVRKPPEL